MISKIDRFGLDTITFSGTLPAKLDAIKAAGFTQVMLNAKDLTGHHGGVEEAIDLVLSSGLRVTGFQVLRDFEGLEDHLHEYKVDIAKSMLQMCSALGSPVLLACSSTSRHASADPQIIAKSLRKLAMLALPLNIKIAFEGLSWGRHINEALQAWQAVKLANAPNLGIGLDTFHIFAAKTDPAVLKVIDPSKIFLVQLSDFMWNEVPSFEERMTTARTFRVFPGEGVHSDGIVTFMHHLDSLGYSGEYSFEVFNDDYQQIPLKSVAERGKKSAVWLAEDVLRTAFPVKGRAH